MQTSFRHFGNQSAANWEAEIRAAQEELRLYGHEMSPYERNVISREIKRRQDELIPVVGAMVIGEFHSAIKKYQGALAKVEAEKAAEINRFDVSKFNNELQAMTTRLKLALDLSVNPLRTGDKPLSFRLRTMYDEAMQSGDIHKQRAALEVLQSAPLPVGNQEERIKINQMTKDAQAAEIKLRQTEGLLQAQQESHAALLELGEKQDRLDKVSTMLGMGSTTEPLNNNAFSRAYKQVQRDPHTGEIKIYKETDPEVTGVYFKSPDFNT